MSKKVVVTSVVLGGLTPSNEVGLPSVDLGGPGSGNWGHAGRKGKVGGSSSKGTGGSSFQVGITSARPEKGEGQVVKEMEDFRQMLEKTPISGLSVHLGVGGWEGGSEPTFVTQYTGNGEARKALARFGKMHNQDGVLIQKYVTKGTPGSGPQNRILFDGDLGKDQMAAVEKNLVANGMGGWTWGKQNGRPMLMLTYIEAWSGFSGPDEHRRAARNIARLIGQAGYNVRSQERQVSVEIMERSDYDDVIEGRR